MYKLISNDLVVVPVLPPILWISYDTRIWHQILVPVRLTKIRGWSAPSPPPLIESVWWFRFLWSLSGVWTLVINKRHLIEQFQVVTVDLIKLIARNRFFIVPLGFSFKCAHRYYGDKSQFYTKLSVELLAKGLCTTASGNVNLVTFYLVYNKKCVRSYTLRTLDLISTDIGYHFYIVLLWI